jgi:cardiolipin synthase
MMHAKTLILDDWMMIGSSNLNHRSLLHDLEADVRIRTEGAKQKLVQQFLIDMDHSREISLTSWHIQRPWRQRFLGRLVLYIKFCI